MSTTFKNTGFPADEYVEFLGKQGTVIDYGTLSTARDGLQNAQAKFQIPRAYWQALPTVKAKHPIFRNLTVETSEVSFSGVYAIATCSYFGIATEESEPVYDMNENGGEDPIATHPDFHDVIGGAANNRRNGACFRNPGMPGLAAIVSDANPTPNPPNGAGYVFDHFEPIVNGLPNRFYGQDAYLVPGITWRKSWCRRKPITDLSRIKKIDIPEGDSPDLNAQFGGTRNWLLLTISQTKKGACYQCVKEWRASGPRGWNEEVYGLAKPAPANQGHRGAGV